MRDVVIAGYLRTAQSRCRPKDPARDVFAKMRADELLAKLLPELARRTGIQPGEIEDFIVGCATAVGEQWAYGGRFPIFLANFPKTVAAKFVDQQCGSSMAAIHMGYLEIATNNADIVMVGGMEHMTRIPMGQATTEGGLISPNLALFSAPDYLHWDMMTTMNMGLTAQKLLVQSGLAREDMDKWALRSHQLAAKAQSEGFFDDEILPIEAVQADGSVMTVKTDQAVRADTTLEGLAKLAPAYRKDHQITAGNSSPLNAAASSMILMSKETAQAKGIKPLATIKSIGFAGVDPTVMGCGPVPASQKALQKAGLQAKDVDYWEINEAFSIVALNCIKELGLDPDKVNVKGGAIAIGHALGATGIRLVGTLARVLQNRGGRYGCANACVGGGQGVATIIERF
ncbi:3-ketoacyl-CoA thiolase [Syntrophobacter sp. SbD2]|nr:3-ketoacyl-CoA thiolase [Syntrophobacter sp. SbD2]